MSQPESGVITFDKYEVSEVSFILNDNYTNEDKIIIDFEPSSQLHILNDKSQMIVELNLDIFKNTDKNYPFQMSLKLRGYFSTSKEIDSSLLHKYEANTLAILFPYARALVTSYTANANVTPLILPTVNINKMLNKNKVKENRLNK